VHNEETLRNLRESLDALELLVHSQADQIRQLQHERDLLAAAFSSASRRADSAASAVDPVKG
jgi:ABC-type transporter Mla subunit MlaD